MSGASAGTTPLQNKIGASASGYLDAGARANAEASLLVLRNEAHAVCAARVAQMRTLLAAKGPDFIGALFQRAHDLRGVAGSFGLASLGEIADAMCLYLDDLPEGRSANAPLLSSLVRALEAALRPADSDTMLVMSAECRAAVRVVRKREGRTAELG